MSDLRTPFEQRDHEAPWTSVQEGNDYMTALVADSPNLTEEIVGESVNGAPMRLYKLGTGDYHVVIVCQQHGEELSGREAMFTLLREWAHTTNPEMVAYLQRVTLLVLPTAHPDDTEVRENSNGVNLNRDHIQLTQPETQAIHAVLRDYTPDIVLDVHEGRNITNNYATGPALNGNIDPDLADLSLALEGVVRDAITGEGYTWERYQGASAIVGAENLSNNAGVQNYLSLLLESRRTAGDDTDAAERYATQLIALQAIIDWHQQNLHTVRDIVSSARANIIQRTAPLQLMTGTLPFNGPIIDPLPTGYLLTPAQHSAIELHRDRFSITSIRVHEGWFVSTGQMAQIVIAYLLDPDSPEHVTSGARDYRTTVIPYDPPVADPVDLSHVVGYKFNLDGAIYDAILRTST